MSKDEKFDKKTNHGDLPVADFELNSPSVTYDDVRPPIIAEEPDNNENPLNGCNVQTGFASTLTDGAQKSHADSITKKTYISRLK